MSGAASLQCMNLWKVYGANAGLALRASDRGDAAATAAELRSKGLVVAVSDVSLEVKPGETFVIMGLSGSGKSTVVRCLSRLIEPTAGDIRFDGADLRSLTEAQLVELRRHRMGMVFQHFGLFPHMTVMQNVAYPLRVQGIPPGEREKRAAEMNDNDVLTGRESRFPRELSGGMQQRVGIARSLAVRPGIWFLDEPFSALDPLIRRQMQDEVHRLQGVMKKTIVFITHDFLEALRLADRIAVMRDGQIVQVGTPSELVLRPADPYVAAFTRDVPRDKIVTAGAIMDPPGQNLSAEFAVPANAVIETVIPLLVGRARPLAVLGEGDTIIGQISVERLLAALAQRP